MLIKKSYPAYRAETGDHARQQRAGLSVTVLILWITMVISTSITILTATDATASEFRLQTGIPSRHQVPDQDSHEERIKRALVYLWSKQSADGSWKSEYYGNLKQGAATTSLVLFAFSQCSDRYLLEKQPNIEKAFRFLRRGIVKNGYVSNEGGPDYANYATALTLLAADNLEARVGWKFLTDAERKKLVVFLTQSQLDETHGLVPTDDNYGGWDLSGWVQEPRESPGTNISITSFVLLALKHETGKEVRAAQDKARKWLSRVLNKDHGFHFHSEKKHVGNKAEWTDELAQKPRSYGSATVDGIRAFRSLGFPREQISRSAQWLLDNSDSSMGVTIVPGFDLSDLGGSQSKRDSSWAQGLLYYYFAGLALEKSNLPGAMKTKCAHQIPRYLAAHQQKDGRWENSSARMREDDPLIATSFAVIALINWQKPQGRK